MQLSNKLICVVCRKDGGFINHSLLSVSVCRRCRKSVDRGIKEAGLWYETHT